MNIIVDCEASGPCPTCGDLIEFAAIAEDGRSFTSDKFSPMFDKFDPGAYHALKLTRAEHIAYTGSFNDEAARFQEWLGQFERCTFWSDNPAFDWQWINWLFHSNGLGNPFGFSARRIGDLYAGLTGDIKNHTKWKKFRKTKHTHDPLDDARGNLEAFEHIRKTFKI
jgi:hypothetical protein